MGGGLAALGGRRGGAGGSSEGAMREQKGQKGAVVGRSLSEYGVPVLAL